MNKEGHIRNFVIIAHIDHGKSTLADRMLEITGTVEARRMRAQYLDQLDLERERGITIKMAPVRMKYGDYILNLIDTPGHSDFSYEVSRALHAVEGAVLLVDVTKGIQAQTLSKFRIAREAGLTIIGAVNKIDLNPPQAGKALEALAKLLECDPSEIFKISGKTGEGVEKLLEEVVVRIPAPRDLSESEFSDSSDNGVARALIFDSLYDDHKGILAYVRVFEGEVKAGDEVELLATGARFKIKEVGYFAPELKTSPKIAAGEIGYIATGFKEPAKVRVGDTVIRRFTRTEARNNAESRLALPGYKEPGPVVFISFYPDGDTKFEELERAFARLHLTDAALFTEPDANEALGRGLKVGFLGQLHFEITAARLEREFKLDFLTSFPSIAYRVVEGGNERIVKDAHEFPIKPDHVFEPMIAIEILTPSHYLQKVLQLQTVFALQIKNVETMGDNLLLHGEMPLAELIHDFDDQLKSVSAGFASFSYEIAGEAETDAVKMEILIAGDVIAALTRIVNRKDVEREGRATVERLKELLPRQQFVQAIQASVEGRIIARATIPALKKDVTGYLYGGDRSRKMKLWKKQQRGKARLKESARVDISPELFREILKK